jgi:hypothetical protein
VETFVVRVFVAAEGEPVPLRGVVEHVASGSREPFESLDRLISLLETSLSPPDPAAIDQKGEPQ